jgi:hypothetical protein
VSFRSVWGFDPEEALHAQQLFRERIGAQESAYCSVEEQAAEIPPDANLQIDELYRMFRSEDSKRMLNVDSAPGTK